MIRYQLFPRNKSISEELSNVIKAFESKESCIDSHKYTLKSNQVLEAVRPELEQFGFKVEKGKSDEDKITVPVLFGRNNAIDKCFFADAISGDGKIVVEVEAGRAIVNNQFLKDIFQASMMYEVDYLVIAIRNIYRASDDFEKIYTFLDTMYVSDRIKLPLRGILIIGY